MKKVSTKKSLILLTTGIFAIAATQIVARYVPLSDLMKGLFTGVGFGLLILSLLFKFFRANEKLNP